MLTPKRVHLVVKDVSVSEAVAELARVSGYPIEITGDRRGLNDRKVTLDTGDVTFWEALQQLRQKGGLVEKGEGISEPVQAGIGDGQGPMPFPLPVKMPGLGGFPGGIPRGPLFGRMPGLPGFPGGILPGVAGLAGGNPAGPPAEAAGARTILLADGPPQHVPVCFVGAVRISVLPSGSDQAALPPGEIQLLLEVAAEPSLKAFRVSPPQIDRALDDQGQALINVPVQQPGPPEAPKGPGGIQVAKVQRFVMVNGKVIFQNEPPTKTSTQRTVPVRLKLGNKAARSLRELSGSLPVQSVKDNQALVTVNNLLKAAGKRFEGADGSALEIQAVDKLPDGGLKVRLVVEDQPQKNPLAGFPGGNNVVMNVNVKGNANGALFGAPRLGAPTFPRLLDAQGKDCAPAEVTDQNTHFNAVKVLHQATLTYYPQGDPAQLVLYGAGPVTWSVPFTLKTIPLP
jgi:hypothetical protein